MKDNQLATILKEQAISQERSSELLAAFGAPFEEAGEILADYETVKVSDEGDKETMALARSKRLALKKVRTTVENRRKELKEGIVKQGRAIDSVARFVKEVISPAEEYLQMQEDYAKIKEQERLAQKRAERIERLSRLAEPVLYNIDSMDDEAFDSLVADLQAKADADRRAAEQAEVERKEAERAERQRQVEIAAENERLRKEAEEKEAERQVELAAIRTKQEKERAEQEAALAKEREAAEAERRKREALERAEQERLEAEARAKASEEEAERSALLAPDRQKLILFADALATIRAEKLPAVKSNAAQSVVNEIQDSLLELEARIRNRARKL